MAYIDKKLAEKYGEPVLSQKVNGEKKTLNAEEMSEFYRIFLNENHSLHLNYNKDWYSKKLSKSQTCC